MFYQHLKSLLSIQKTQEILSQGKTLGFEKAKVNYYGKEKEITQVRNNSRVEWNNVVLAQELESVLQEKMGNDFPYFFKDVGYKKMGSHFRIYHYQVGEYFKPHRDGSFQDKEQNSEITVLFYLNDTDGGDTILMPYGPRFTQDYIHIKPHAGDCLMFEHAMWHEGHTVNSGEKFVLRSDLFFG